MTAGARAGQHAEAASPSRWSRRALLAGLALGGLAIATYLAAYQLGAVPALWDPLFGRDAESVLRSPVERMLPVPDAALGAVAYAAEVVTGLIGGSERWRRRPWAVLLFGAIAGSLALAGIVLVSLQVFVLDAFCTLCLTSAAISLVVAALAVEEVLATIGWLQTETALGRPLREAVLDGERTGWWAAPAASSPATTTAPAAASPATTASSPGSAASLGSPRPALTTRKGQTAMTMHSEQPSEDAKSSSPAVPPARPGGPDVDGGDELAWRGPDRSTRQGGEPLGVAVVTGAAAGLGRAIVREFAKHGYDVGLIARDEASLENAKAEVEACGGRGLVCVADVADPDAVEAAAERIERELGPIDVWVNDAMVSVFAPVKAMKPDEYRRVTEVNYLGYVYGTQAALKRMLPRDRGVIVHVGSALAYRAIPLQSAYCASKHAIQGFHEALRCELLHDRSRVRTTMVQMPALNTPQFDWVENKLPDRPQPVPPIYEPEVGAEAVYWASQHPRREVVVGVTTWGAIQLNKLIPGMLDWYLARTGYESQQTAQPDDPNRPNDVWEPVPGDRGAHGRFDRRSTPSSVQLWATTHRGLVAGAVGVAGLLAIGGAQAVTSLMRPNGRRR